MTTKRKVLQYSGLDPGTDKEIREKAGEIHRFVVSKSYCFNVNFNVNQFNNYSMII